ncbi:MAG TPA: DUF5362 family protein [Puia sp.]|nr:DUF5362 family protein [Puia sp.]
MEPNSTPGNLFDLQIDAQSNGHLFQAAKWAKFLSVVGFICCGLLAVYGIFAGILFGSISRNYNDSNPPFGAAANLGGAFVLVFAVAGAVLYFFPCLYLFRFGSKMQTALRNNDQNHLTNSFGNLKSFYKFLGILTIIGLALFFLEIIFVMIFASRAVY